MALESGCKIFIPTCAFKKLARLKNRAEKIKILKLSFICFMEIGILAILEA
jgi:hypothetical protein